MLVQEEHTAPLASVWCWYKVGSKDERPGLTGVSHWVEHMNFKGTDEHPARPGQGHHRAVRRQLERVHVDRSDHLSGDGDPRRARPHAVHRGRADGACLYHPDDCESERTVIISELQGGENDPDQLLDQELTATAFKAHPYRHPTIGWLPDLADMTRDDLYGYYRRYYVPNNATLVDRRRRRRRRSAAASASIISGRFPQGEPPRATADVEPEQTGERRCHPRVKARPRT